MGAKPIIVLRHFDRSARGGYAVKPALRARVSWAAHNRWSRPPRTCLSTSWRTG